MSTIVVEALDKPGAFDAAHSIVMLLALSTVAIAIVSRCFMPAVRCCRRGGVPWRSSAALAAPVLLFGALNWQALGKAWRTLQGEKLLVVLQGPLRAAALIAAAVPSGHDKTDGTPAGYAALQVASLAASLSVEVAQGRLAKSLGAFSQQPMLNAAFDSSLLKYVAPAAIALLWVALVHLQRKPIKMMMAALLSVMSSPVVAALGWERAALSLGLGGSLATAKGLTQVLSVLYTVTAVTLFIAGGTISLVSVMVMAQLLVRIHGVEAFTEVFG